MLGIIGGSGLSHMPDLAIESRRVVATPYGTPSAPLTIGRLGGRDVTFVARHGDAHTIPPHRVNYRANLWALRSVGVSAIAAVFAVGGIAAEVAPGRLAVPHQLIDYTHGREHTFSDLIDQAVVHVDFTEPYDPRVRERLISAARSAGIDVLGEGTYAAVNGPRLETAAEIDRLERDGATMVGMTGMPEAGLARELGIPYAALAVSVNCAAGRGDSVRRVALVDIGAVLAQGMEMACRVLEQWVRNHD